MNVTRQDESPGASWCFLSLFSLFFTTPRYYVSSLDGVEQDSDAPRALRRPEGTRQQRLECGVASPPRVELGHGRERSHAGVPGRRQAVHRVVDPVGPASQSRRRPPAAGSTRSGWVSQLGGPSVAAGGAFPATRPTASSPRPSAPASPAVRKPAAAATRPPSAGVAAGMGGSPLPPSRPEPSKSLRRHLVPPGRVPPCPAASVGASVMSRRPPTGVASPPPPRRPWRGVGSRGGGRARPFTGGPSSVV